MIQPNIREKICAWCGEPWTAAETGRPASYCGTKCRQAANRLRKSSPAPPDTQQLDEQLLEDFQDVQDELDDLLGSLDYPGAPPEDPLRILTRIQHRLDTLTPGLVGRARARNTGWQAIGEAMNLTPDTVRHKYASGLERYQRKRAPRSRRPGAPPRRPRTDLRDDGAADASPSQAPAPQRKPPAQLLQADDLAPALSALQRASGHTLRAVAEQARLSPSYLSRIIAGERVPSWAVTARLARACGTTPAQLRPLWEKATARRGTKKEEPTLQSALRYLHLRAGQPAAATLAVDGTLSEHEITSLLDGTALPSWEAARQLVYALDGEVTYFEPLWQAAAQDTPAADDDQHGGNEPEMCDTTAPDGVFRLLAQFSGVLRNGPELAPQRTARVRRTIAERLAANHGPSTAPLPT